MKKIALIALFLFGIGLSATIYASDRPEKKTEVEKAPLCAGNIMNRTPCPVNVCLSFIDCSGAAVTVCLVVGPGSVMPYNAFTGGCCNTITGVSVQGVPPAAPPSPIVPVGGMMPYVTGNPPPCDKWMVDFSSMLPNCLIRP